MFSELRLGGGSPNSHAREGVTAGLPGSPEHGRRRGVQTETSALTHCESSFFSRIQGHLVKKQAAGGAGKRKRLSSGTEGLGEGSRALPRAALQGPGLADSEKTPARSVPGNQTQREGTDLQCGVATSGVEVSTERSRRLTETSGSQGNFLS